MPSLSPKDRVSLCLFSFTDGRRCRTPRTGSHPHFCFYHAQKEAQSQSTEKLAKDLAYFFSGNYLSACDLNTALGRLIPAVIRGEIKPRLARTVAYMLQTLMQSTRLSQHEYINAFGTDGWRQAVRTSVNSNSDYLFPPAPEPKQSAPSSSPQTQPQQVAPVPASSLQPRQTPASAPQSPAGFSVPTSAPGAARLQPATSASATQQPPSAARPSVVDTEAALSVARSLFPSRPSPTPAQSAPAEACHPERSEGPRHHPASSTTDETRLAPTPAQSAQPNNAPLPAPPRPQPQPAAPSRDPRAVHYDHNYRLLLDGKPW